MEYTGELGYLLAEERRIMKRSASFGALFVFLVTTIVSPPLTGQDL